MKNFKTKEEAFASQNFDPNAVKLEGVPAHHVEAVKSIINLFVAHDAVNPEFNPDFTNYKQDKYNSIWEVGSPSGAGFAYYNCGGWNSFSVVGSRLVSESIKASEHIGKLFEDDYKKVMVYDRKI